MAENDPTVKPMGVAQTPGVKAVVGVFDTMEQARSAHQALIDAGRDPEDISLIGRGSPPEYGAEDTKAGQAAVTGATVGAVLGGLAGLALLAVPGVGPLLAAGPIASALTGALAGGAMGGLAGSFAGLGMPTEHARRYEDAVRGGGVVLTANVADADGVRAVESLMTEYGAREVSGYTPGL